MIEDPGTLTYWIFKAIVHVFLGLVFGSAVLLFLRALGRAR